jgi:tetratricopeptide (TPR) repeat protein
VSIEALKEQARQNEQWEKALDLYSRAIDQMSEGDDPDVGLFNRSGDLATRIGRQAQAVTFYEKAVDFYVAAGLPNNAIAICKKESALEYYDRVFALRHQLRRCHSALTKPSRVVGVGCNPRSMRTSNLAVF